MKKAIIFPWTPVEFSKYDASAIQALARGEASDRQQQRALNWILNNLCELHGLSYRPDEGGGDRGTAFAEGKRFVALQICKVINTNLDNLKE